MKLVDWIKRVARDTSAEYSSSRIDEYDALDPYDPFPDPVTIEIADVIDLHTIQPRDVRLVVEEYLLEARAKGFHTVRIIHGKGIGVQREIVRNVLARTPFVDDWTDAPPDAGGMGATLVRLRSYELDEGGGE